MSINRHFFDQLGSVARRAITAAASSQPQNKAKSDSYDPVTLADWAAEKAMRKLIEEQFPEHGIWGEEFGWTREGQSVWWSLDPIDGTRAFVCGLPSWAILAGHLQNGEHIAGMIDMPRLDERFIACEGATRCNGKPVRASDCTSVSKARLATTDPGLFEKTEAAAFSRLRDAALVTRYGLDAMAYARLAAGDLDLVAETGLFPHDRDALIPVVRGAGGHIGNWRGGGDFSGGDLLAAATRELYEEAVSILSGG